MLNTSAGWNDLRWAQLYPPTASRQDPALDSIDGSENPGGLPPSLPHYTELLKAEAAANPAPPGIAMPSGLAIAHPELNPNTLL